MPQFDFFAWASISFWTVLSFHIFYLFVLRFVLSPISEMQKAQQKLTAFFSRSSGALSLKDMFLVLYFRQIKLHRI